jgi:hypothetical protein
VDTHGSKLANSPLSRFNPIELTRRGFCRPSQPSPLEFWLLRHAVFAFYNLLPRSAFATYVGGSRVGIFSAILGGLIGWWAFMPEYFFFTRGRELELMYVLACGFLIWGRQLSQARRASPKEEDLRKLVVENLRIV